MSLNINTILQRTQALRSQSDIEWHEYLDDLIELVVKEVGIKPIKYEGNIIVHRCGNCLSTIKNINKCNYCTNCGYKINLEK